MNNIKVSIIIPVYNVADYLCRCLDSCVYQTLQEIEIIVINDCSQDEREAEIMKDYAERFPSKVKLIWHHENTGQGEARNTGIKAAHGEFIQFVDSDDYIDLKMSETLYQTAKSENADFVLCNVNHLANGKLISNWNQYEIPDTDNKVDRFSKEGIHSCWRLIISRELLVEKKLYFPKGIFYEDFICCLWHMAAKKIAYVEDALYYYVQRIGSTVNISNLEKRLESQKDIFVCIEYMFDTDYYKSLSIELKMSIFIYLFNTYLFSNFQFISKKFPEKFREWCCGLQRIRNLSGIDFNSGIFNHDNKSFAVKQMLKLVDENIDKPDLSEKAEQYCISVANEKLVKMLFQIRPNRIVIWGAGIRGRRLAKFLTGLNYYFEITDINPSLYGENICGKVVKPWDDLKGAVDLVIVSAQKAYNDVIKQINNPSIKIIDSQRLNSPGDMTADNIKVSIIIPVYNGAEFIRRSFDSCIYQTLPEIEIIAVNDCSPNPRDAEIMLEYEKLYPDKFRALFHEVNKRQGGARNTGIRAARGEYFLCVDQDDYLELDMCGKMYAKAKSKNADLCMCGYNVFIKGNTTYTPPILYSAESLDTHGPPVWKLLTKKSFIVENNVFFPENVVTDDVISILWFALTDRYCTITEPFYNWMRHDGAESFAATYRYAHSVPISFITISEYYAYKNLSDEKKKWFNIILVHHLYSSSVICIVKYPDKLLEHSRLIAEVLRLYSPEFIHPVFSKTVHGKSISLILQYIKNNIEDKNFAMELAEFYDKMKCELIVERLSNAIAEKILPFKQNGTITIWGAGIRGARLAGYLSKIDVPFEITDINQGKYGNIICGVAVKPWDELKDKTNLVIVTPLRVFEDIKRTIGDANIEIIDFMDLLKL